MSKKIGEFRMPAEWEPQKSVWMSWPHNKNDWPRPIIFIVRP